MENNTKTKVTYDDRRKELTQVLTSNQEIKVEEEIVGKVSIERKAVFPEKGIRKILDDLSKQKTKTEQTLKQLTGALKEIPEMTEDLIELEKKIQTINNFNKNKQLKSQIENAEEDLKEINKNINQIKETIGSRLKF
jgi:peptidoglycan hydrolase CwlO-like protein